MWLANSTRGLTALLCCCLALAASGQDEPRIGELSYLDRQYMTQQRASLQELTTRHFGRSFSGEVDADLQLLQILLDKRLVRADQTEKLQAMGIVMGDLLAADLGMHWVFYEDRLGRSRALRYKSSDNYLFPVTMISRRREVGNDTPVREIYQKAVDEITPALPTLPYQ